ncbi:related to MFS multidrug transporter [Pseudozyma flocculosa]|uniref:Related to MFS multidrug transporter n=1 Tax=Pseudozyma flocculosa TaxID=84751 RepID=A0A5C3F7C2_9BASI|nr:related to MFS multidrug transporter [Pseudozyma flocculosa]
MSARDASTRDAKIPTPRRAGRHDPPTFFVPSTSASAPASAATPDNAGPPHPAAPAGNDHRPTLNAKEASSRSLGLRLTRTHSRKDLYDADAGSVDGEFGAYGHASEDQAHAGAAPVRRMHSRSKSKTQRHETVLERIGDLERDDVELGAHEARQLAEVRAGGTGEDEMDHERRRVHTDDVDLEKQPQQHGKGAVDVATRGSSRSSTPLSQDRQGAESTDSQEAADAAATTTTAATAGEKDAAAHDPNLVTWDSADSPENPRNWSQHRRWAVVLIVSSYTFLSPLASSMIAPALPLLSEQFGVTSSVQQNLMLSTFVLAYALGPLVLAPLSEMFGRRLVLQSANLVFIIFNIGCGASQTSTQMTVLRFFAGLGGSAPLAAGGGTVADLFEPADRGTAMAVYSLAPLLGPAIGPIVGGWIVQQTGRWRLIFWATSGYGGLTALVGFLLLPETYAPRILHSKRNRLRKQTGNAALHTVFDADGGEAWYTRFGHNLVRPFILLTTQPIIQVFSVFMMILYGCMYILLTVFPLVFEETYGERPGVASLNYISLAIGFTVGGQVGGRVVDRVYRRLRDGRGGGVGQPEYKLPLLMVSSLLLPVGLVVYGWTAERRVHWIVPNLGAVVFSAGLMASFLVSQSYLVDVMPLYAASALAAAVFLRSLGGFGFPLFAPVMYDKLGQGWGNSVLALISAIVGIPAPWLLWRYGPYLRSKSQYASKQKAGNALS